MNGKFTGLSIYMEALEKAKDDKMLIEGIFTSFFFFLLHTVEKFRDRERNRIVLCVRFACCCLMM